MEVPIGVIGSNPSSLVGSQVLILVLVEVPIGDMQKGVGEPIDMVLILVLVEVPIGERKGLIYDYSHWVLILVLVEVPIGGGRVHADQHQQHQS